MRRHDGVGVKRCDLQTPSWPISAAACVVLSGLLITARPLKVEGRAGTSQLGTKGATIDEAKLERRSSVSCVGSQVIELNGVLIRSDAVAVAAAGGCEVRIKDSHIVGKIAVQTAGGTVTIENTVIDAGTLAFQIAGDSTVSIKSSTVLGGVQRASGSFKDLGNNIFR
jgi:hypothetical protein